MATFDLNSGTGLLKTPRTGHRPHDWRRQEVFTIERRLNMRALVDAGWTQTDGDVFKSLIVPANHYILTAGAEVLEAFNGTTPTVDIDFDAGDDIVDGGDVAAVGYLASGTNGQANVVPTPAVSNFVALANTDRVIDVKLINAAADVTEGLLRVYATLIDMTPVVHAPAGLTPRNRVA